MKILVVRFSSLGDVILTTGVLKRFKEQFPDSEITLLTYNEFKGLFSEVKFIDNVISIDRNINLKNYIQFLRSHLEKHDWVVDLHCNLRSRLIKLLKPLRYLSYQKKSSLRRAFVRFRLFKKHLNTHVIERYAAPFSKAFGFDYKNLEELRPSLPTTHSDFESKRIVLHPFASKKTKVWPYFFELTESLLQRGYAVTLIGVGQFNSPEEAKNLIGKTNMQEMLDEISKANLLITTDSGPLHAGIALNRKVLSLFGPSTRELGFYPDFQHSEVLENSQLSCRPCHVHGLDQCPKKHFKCMSDISLNNVLDKAQQLLK